MTTTETINGNFVTIEWIFEDRGDRIDTHWYQWYVTGRGSDGKMYEGQCEADEDATMKDFKITDLEEIEKEEDYDLPENWEPDYNGTTQEEIRDQMIAAQKLK